MVYETGDAAGQNTSSAMSWEAIQRLQLWAKIELPDVQVQYCFIDGNAAGDKHQNHVAMTFGKIYLFMNRLIVKRFTFVQIVM